MVTEQLEQLWKGLQMHVGRGNWVTLRDQGRHLGGGVSGAPGQVPECSSGSEAVSVFFPREDNEWGQDGCLPSAQSLRVR